MSTVRRPTRHAKALISVPVLLVAAGAWFGFSALHDRDTTAAPVVAPHAVAAASGALIDHSVVDRDDLLPEPNPGPAAVAAYDD